MYDTVLDVPPMLRLEPGSARYPVQVANKRAPTLFAVGNLDLLDLNGVGFCGSRKASSKGLETAWDSATQLAEAGFTVISGNAAGVDAEAHKAALSVGGSTILVLPEGINHFRVKKELRSVWDWSRVLVLSQYEPTSPWQSFRAMERNTLIIALSKAMIVIEAGSTGGTLHAGMTTLKSKRPLFVAVYEDMENAAPGNAALLKLGALRLTKSRQTGRASVMRISDAIDALDHKPSSELLQPNLF